MSPSSSSPTTASPNTTTSPGQRQRRTPRPRPHPNHTNLNSQCKRLAMGQCIITQLLIGTVIWAFVPMIVLYNADLDKDVLENTIVPFQNRLNDRLSRLTQQHKSKLQKWYDEEEEYLQKEKLEMDQREEQYQHDRKNFKAWSNNNYNNHNKKDHRRSLLLREKRTTTTTKNNNNNNNNIVKQKKNNHNHNTKKKDTASSKQNDQQTNTKRKTPLLRSTTNAQKREETKTKDNNKKPVTTKSSESEKKKDDDHPDQHHEEVIASKRKQRKEEKEETSPKASATLLTPASFKKKKEDTDKNTKNKKDDTTSSSATKETNKDTKKRKKNHDDTPLKEDQGVDAKAEAEVKSPAKEDPPQQPYSSKLRVIVTGMEHTGTTVLSELIMSAPGLNGPFETGFLLAETPLDFYNTSPFYDWLSRSDIRNAFLELTAPQIADVLNSNTHADMYEYVLKHSKFFLNSPTPTEYYVDKTPLYVYHLRDILERAPPDVKVVVSAKSYEHLKESWTQRHGMTEQEVDHLYKLYTQSLSQAQEEFPNRIFVQNYEDLLGKYVKGDSEGANQAGQTLFDFLDLEWKDAYLTGKPFKEKGWRNCNLCVLHKT